MSFIKILTLISCISFIVYGIAYFTSPHMKNEFRRFGLEKPGLLIAILQLTGAIGLIVGFRLTSILLISSGGLATALVGIKHPDQLALHPFRGNLFENMIVLECLKYLISEGVYECYLKVEE